MDIKDLILFVRGEGKEISEFKSAEDLCEFMGFAEGTDDHSFVTEFWEDIKDQARGI